MSSLIQKKEKMEQKRSIDIDNLPLISPPSSCSATPSSATSSTSTGADSGAKKRKIEKNITKKEILDTLDEDPDFFGRVTISHAYKNEFKLQQIVK